MVNEYEAKRRLENNISEFKKVRIEDRKGIENNLGVIKKDIVVFVASFKQDVLTEVREELRKSDDEESNKLNKIRKNIRELDLIPSDYKLKDDETELSLNAGEMFVVLEQKRE